MLAIDTIKVQVLYGDALVAAGLAATLRDQPDIGLLAAGTVDVIVTDYEHGLALLTRARADLKSHRSRSRQC